MKGSSGRVGRGILVALLALAGIGAGVYVFRSFLLGRPAAVSEDVYYCPMHPTYRSNQPGECAICNMTLVNEAGETHEHGEPPPAGMGAEGEGLPPGTVRLTPAKQHLIGVQYGEVGVRPVAKTIRSVGRVAMDETRLFRLHPKIEGWVETVEADFLGKQVRKGQALLSLYSPELLATQQELLLARRAKDSLGNNPLQDIASGAVSLYESSRARLQLWDVSEQQIDEIEAKGVPLKSLSLYSPLRGYVVSRNAYPGQRVTPETELYLIADLSTIWVLAEVYEYELPLVRLGQRGTMTLPYLPGRTYRGRVTYVYPELDKMTRTLKVRLEFPNPGLELKPDMYANVELAADLGEHLTLPEEAVLDSGTEQLVFVAREGGYFEPRRVTLGEKVGNLYIVHEGVQAGEKVVTSANFLIDSESRLKSALTQMKH
jgi:RND family efflux transporter MFP subunit